MRREERNHVVAQVGNVVGSRIYLCESAGAGLQIGTKEGQARRLLASGGFRPPKCAPEENLPPRLGGFGARWALHRAGAVLTIRNSPRASKSRGSSASSGIRIFPFED